jgi:cell division protein FtsB
MSKLSKYFFFLGLILFFILVYTSVLGTRGVWERKNMESRLETLQEEVFKLETESNFLQTKRKILLEDKNALAKEAIKHYKLSEEAKIIHFKEPAIVENNDKLFASTIPVAEIKKKYKVETNASQGFIRFLYMFVVSAILIVLFYKLKEEP